MVLTASDRFVEISPPRVITQLSFDDVVSGVGGEVPSPLPKNSSNTDSRCARMRRISLALRLTRDGRLPGDCRRHQHAVDVHHFVHHRAFDVAARLHGHVDDDAAGFIASTMSRVTMRGAATRTCAVVITISD